MHKKPALTYLIEIIGAGSDGRSPCVLYAPQGFAAVLTGAA